MQELKKRNVEATPTRYSPWGVEVAEGADFRVFAQDVYKLGCVRDWAGLGWVGSVWAVVCRRITPSLTGPLLCHHPRYVDLMNEASQCVVLSTGAKPYDIVLLHGARKVHTRAVVSCGVVCSHDLLLSH